MKALTFHGKRDVRVDEVPDPMMQIFDKGLQLRMGQAHVRQ